MPQILSKVVLDPGKGLKLHNFAGKQVVFPIYHYTQKAGINIQYE